MVHIAGHIPQTGLIGSEQALRSGLAGGLSGLEQGINQGRADLSRFAQGGRSAFEIQRSLSGASGTGAQQRAFERFNASPGQTFLRDEAEQALLRNQSAIGGLGGGRVRSELQKQAIGLAQQDFSNQFNRLGSVAGQGLQAAGQQAQLAGLGGTNAANLAFQTGQSLAGGRTRAGEAIAGNIGSTTSALSQLLNQQGAGLSDILGGATGNLANLLSGAGVAQGASQTQLATILANIAAQQGSGSQTPGIPNIQQTPGILGGLGQLAGGVGTAFAAFSDIRMKENIEKVGTHNGFNFYTWDWKEEIDQIPFGVIAQEIQLTHPEAVSVHENGMLQVDYSKVI